MPCGLVHISLLTVLKGTLPFTSCLARDTLFLCVSVLHLYIIIYPRVSFRPRSKLPYDCFEIPCLTRSRYYRETYTHCLQRAPKIHSPLVRLQRNGR